MENQELQANGAEPEDGHTANGHDEEDVNFEAFGNFIRILEDGAVAADLDKELRKITRKLKTHAVVHGGKAAASLSLTFGFKLERGLFQISTTFKSKLPEAKRDLSIAFVGSDYRFTPDNPRQPNLPFEG